MKKAFIIAIASTLLLTACSKENTDNTEVIHTSEVVEATTENTTEEKTVSTSETTESTTESTTEEKTEEITTQEETESTTEMEIDPNDELPPLDYDLDKWAYNPKISGLSLFGSVLRGNFRQESFVHAIKNSIADYEEYREAICTEAKIVFVEPGDPCVVVVVLSFENHEDTKIYMHGYMDGNFRSVKFEDLDYDPEKTSI